MIFCQKPCTMTETSTTKGEKVGQEFAFDLDPENVTCPVHGTLADKMKQSQGLSFCEIELELYKKKPLDSMSSFPNGFPI